MKYKTLLRWSYVDPDDPTNEHTFQPGEEFDAPDKKRFPTPVETKFLIEQGAIEVVKEGRADG